LLSSGQDTLWPDDWTAVTGDGSYSAQFEHTMLVTEDGVELLTARLPTSRADVTTTFQGKTI
jgi:methionyl aminopeptidase